LQVRAPLLGRGWGRLCKSTLSSLGRVRRDYSSQLSPPWEGSGEVMQVSSLLLGKGQERFHKLALPSLGGVGGGSAS